MRLALFIAAWVLLLAGLDAFAFAQYPDPQVWTPPSVVQSCPGGICPAPSAATRGAIYAERRPVVRATGRVLRGGGRVLRGAGRVLTFPFRVFRGRCRGC